MSRCSGTSIVGGPLISSGSPPPPYQLITQWGTLFDPDSRTTTGTGHTAGTINLNMAGDTTAYNGFQENTPGFEVNIASVPFLKDFNPSTHIIDIILQIDTFPLAAGGDGYGPGIIFCNQPFSSVGTTNGYGLGVRRFNASVHTAHAIAGTGPSGSSSVADSTHMRALFEFYEGSSNGFDMGAYQKFKLASTGFWESPIIASNAGANLSATGSFYIRCAMLHNTTTTATFDSQFKVYARLLEFDGVIP